AEQPQGTDEGAGIHGDRSIEQGAGGMSLTFDEATHTYRVNGRPIPSVTGILRAENFIDTAFFTDYGRERGKLAHLAIHLLDMGELDEESLDPVLSPFVEAWKRFRADTGVEIIESEQPIVDPLRRYAGTPDKIAMLYGKTTVLDVKTGTVSPWVRLQLCAYCEAKGIYRRAAVQLNDDGTYKMHTYTDRQDFGVWNATLAVYWWKANELKKRRG
ncbi:MAG: hypothetical protein ABFD97_18200, partial [Syntrophobacter sp.]